ncbi:MAG: hypothetical protein ACRDIL_16605, partial [Candidatus Limnocylindrales bacterium]
MAERDLGETLARISTTKVNRRSFLAATGLLGGSAALAACSTPSGGPTVAPSGGGGTSAAPSVAVSQAPAADVEKELFVYNWSDYIAPENIDAFKA